MCLQKYVFRLILLSKVSTLRGVFEGHVTNCMCLFDRGTSHLRPSKKCELYDMFFNICLQKLSFGLKFLHQVVTLRGVFEGHVTNCRCFLSDHSTSRSIAPRSHGYPIISKSEPYHAGACLGKNDPGGRP